MRAARKSSSIESGLNCAQELFRVLQQDEAGFQRLSGLLKEHAGINLPLNHKNLSLMASRLSTLLKDHGCADYSQYFAFLAKHPQKETLLNDFIKALTTNTTQFFREENHFKRLAELLPNLLKQKRPVNSNEIRVWCAAASTGQEPYTLGMVLNELTSNHREIKLKILATDIDGDVLERASSGIYQQAEAEQISPSLLQKYFNWNSELNSYQVSKGLRELICFAPLNLVDPFPFEHPFDIIFCRNVLIYFDSATVQKVIDKMCKALAPGGYLFLGHSECGVMRHPELSAVGSATYQKIRP